MAMSTGNNMNRSQNILVTGAYGFIGRHFVASLLRDGLKVAAVDTSPVFPEEWLGSESRGDVQWYQADIGSPDQLAAVFEDARPESIVHLAAFMGHRECKDNPALCYRSNVSGMHNILDMCTIFNINKLIYSSTTSVYGSAVCPCREENAPASPHSLYAQTKRTAELMMQSYCTSLRMHGHVLRMGNVYGPGQKETRVIYRFTRQIYSDEPLTIRGRLENKRNYLYIDDCVRALKTSFGSCSGFDIFNIGGNRESSLEEIISILSSLMKKDALIGNYIDDKDGIENTCIDTTKSSMKLGFTPLFSIDEGLKEFVDWFKSECIKGK